MFFPCVSFWPCTVCLESSPASISRLCPLTTQVCAVFLIYWSPQLKQMDYQQLMLFMQKLPTGRWRNQEIEPSQHQESHQSSPPSHQSIHQDWWLWHLWFPKSAKEPRKSGSWKVMFSMFYRLLQSLVGLNLVMRCHAMYCHAHHAMPDFTWLHCATKETLLAEAFVLKSLFHSSPNHLNPR